MLLGLDEAETFLITSDLLPPLIIENALTLTEGVSCINLTSLKQTKNIDIQIDKGGCEFCDLQLKSILHIDRNFYKLGVGSKWNAKP